MENLILVLKELTLPVYPYGMVVSFLSSYWSVRFILSVSKVVIPFHTTSAPPHIQRKYLILGFSSRELKVHDGRAKVWQLDQLRAHISNPKQEAESSLGKTRVFDTYSRSTGTHHLQQIQISVLASFV